MPLLIYLLIKFISKGESLPKSGEEWQRLRKGDLHKLHQTNCFSKRFKGIIADMMHPNFQKRPSAQEVLKLLDAGKKDEKEYKWMKIKVRSLREERKKIEVVLQKEERKLRKRKSFS